MYGIIIQIKLRRNTMGLFDFLKTKKKQSDYMKTNNDNTPHQNENADIIMGRKPSDPNTLLFYRKQFSDKGNGGVEWVSLKHRQGKCYIMLKSAYADYGESLPSLNNIKQKNASIYLDEIKTWQYQQLIDFLCNEFGIILSTGDCITKDEYNCWLKKIRLLSCVADRQYKINNGYADSACCILYNKKKYYFYLKEIGNNKGYSLGQKVYEINHDDYIRFTEETLERSTLSNYVCDLPCGDQDWFEDENFIKSLVHHISGCGICNDSQHYFTDFKHFTSGSECRCQKCGLVVKFNRGWPDRIEPSEMNAFLEKYETFSPLV